MGRDSQQCGNFWGYVVLSDLCTEAATTMAGICMCLETLTWPP